jgi:hypothetical protein
MEFDWLDLYDEDEKGTWRKVSPDVPFLRIKLTYGERHATHAGLIDTGSSNLLISKPVAEDLGIDLTIGEGINSGGASGAFTTYPVGGVKLTVLGIGDELEVDTSWTDQYDPKTDTYFPKFPLVGIKSIFRYYRILVDSRNRKISFEPYG